MRVFLLFVALAVPGSTISGQESVTKPVESPPGAQPFNDQVRPFLAKHCRECHGAEKPKGNLRVDQLVADLTGKEDGERWANVLEQLKSGAMPPKKKPRPAENDLRAVTD